MKGTKARHYPKTKPKITPILKALTFFALFMVLIRIVSDLLLKLDNPYGDAALLFYLLGFPTAFTYSFMKIWDEMSFADLGFKNFEMAPKRFSLGVFIGFSVILSFTASLYFLGYAKVSVNTALPEASIFLQEVFISLIIVYNEELIFRGYMLNTSRKSGLWPSIVVSSATFGVAHMGNPNINVLAVLGLIVAGFLLAVSFLVYEDIWVPLGLHFMWNLTEERIFGMPLSGLSPRSWIFRVELTGPSWITGGNFGPEGGALPIIIELVVILIVFRFWLRRSIPQQG